MLYNVPIKMVVTDDPNNPPDTEKVAMTFHLRLRRDCELPVIKEKLIERHPLLANMISVLYFIDEDGCRTTLFNHRIKSFWKYFENLRDATACIYVNAMMFKHPTKLCTNCSGNIYGIIYTCGRCERHASCLQCVNNGTARCAMHGNFYLTSVTIPMPANISRELNFAQLEEARQREIMRRNQRQRFFDTWRNIDEVSY